ncbi:hypothetical protein D3C84_1186200 [compost metagenome]
MFQTRSLKSLKAIGKSAEACSCLNTWKKSRELGFSAKESHNTCLASAWAIGKPLNHTDRWVARLVNVAFTSA